MTITEIDDATLPIAFEIEVEIASPVCLSAGVPTGNLTKTLVYIPGSTVRGMLAQFYLEQTGVADATFERLFLSGDVTYGNLYLNPHGAPAAPAPLSARSCKHEPGFMKGESKHGVIDSLIQTFAWQTADRNGQEHNTRAAICSECKSPLDRFTRFYESSSDRKQTVPTESLRRVITRSATDDQIQTAKKGALYSLEVLDPTALGEYVPMTGFIICGTKEAASSVAQNLLQPAFEDERLSFFIGTARSRGLGEIKTAGKPIHPINPLEQPVAIDRRLAEFNGAIKEAGIDDGRTYFSITLHSDAIVQDEFFRFHSTIPVPLLAWETGLNAAGLRLETCFTDTHIVSGWNAALRMPKSEVIAVRMGAAFLYSVEGIDEQSLIEKLKTLEARGLGARRTEGFGRVKICDPFHVEARKEFV